MHTNASFRCNLIYRSLLIRENHEDLYRMNVYGDLFDFIFTSKTENTTKRYALSKFIYYETMLLNFCTIIYSSEYHSSIIKRLKELSFLPNSTKDIKLDFIFSHINSKISDSFFL